MLFYGRHFSGITFNIINNVVTSYLLSVNNFIKLPISGYIPFFIDNPYIHIISYNKIAVYCMLHVSIIPSQTMKYRQFNLLDKGKIDLDKKRKKTNFKDCLALYFTFFKIGSVTFGGGYAMLPFIQREIVEKQNWATEEEVLDYYAIGQMTPGIIAINTATFIGFKLQGLAGAIASTLGMVTPSLIIITIIAAFLNQFSDNPIVKKALHGINVVVGVLLVSAVIKMGKKAIVDKIGYIIAAAAFAGVLLTDITPVYFILTGAVFGILWKLWRIKKA